VEWKQVFGQKTSTQPEPDLPCEVGYAWFFEKTVIYGSVQDMLSVLRSRTAKNKHGQFVGIVKCLIPTDPYYVLYEYREDSQMAEAFVNAYGKGKVGALSGGTMPAKEVNPIVVQVMREKVQLHIESGYKRAHRTKSHHHSTVNTNRTLL
jgi:hypothetical protein